MSEIAGKPALVAEKGLNLSESIQRQAEKFRTEG